MGRLKSRVIIGLSDVIGLGSGWWEHLHKWWMNLGWKGGGGRLMSTGYVQKGASESGRFKFGFGEADGEGSGEGRKMSIGKV